MSAECCCAARASRASRRKGDAPTRVRAAFREDSVAVTARARAPDGLEWAAPGPAPHRDAVRASTGTSRARRQEEESMGPFGEESGTKRGAASAAPLGGGGPVDLGLAAGGGPRGPGGGRPRRGRGG